MGNHSNNALDRWTTPGSILPITPYEIWQYEKYGNFYKEKDSEPTTDLGEVPDLQIKIYTNN